jgi:diacylglycerol kinase (ATP)
MAVNLLRRRDRAEPSASSPLLRAVPGRRDGRREERDRPQPQGARGLRRRTCTPSAATSAPTGPCGGSCPGWSPRARPTAAPPGPRRSSRGSPSCARATSSPRRAAGPARPGGHRRPLGEPVGTPLASAVTEDRKLVRIGPREFDHAAGASVGSSCRDGGGPRQAAWRKRVAAELRGVATPVGPRDREGGGRRGHRRADRRAARGHPRAPGPRRPRAARHRGLGAPPRRAARRDRAARAAASAGGPARSCASSTASSTCSPSSATSRRTRRPRADRARPDARRSVRRDRPRPRRGAAARRAADGLDTAGLAAVASAFVHETRMKDPPPRPSRRGGPRPSSSASASGGRSSSTRRGRAAGPPGRWTPGFVDIVWRWAAGADLDDALGALEMTAGDFVAASSRSPTCSARSATRCRGPRSATPLTPPRSPWSAASWPTPGCSGRGPSGAARHRPGPARVCAARAAAHDAATGRARPAPTPELSRPDDDACDGPAPPDRQPARRQGRGRATMAVSSAPRSTPTASTTTSRRPVGPGDATRAARAALEEGCLYLVAVGGDGTVHEVVNGMFDGDEPISPERGPRRRRRRVGLRLHPDLRPQPQAVDRLVRTSRPRRSIRSTSGGSATSTRRQPGGAAVREHRPRSATAPSASAAPPATPGGWAGSATCSPPTGRSGRMERPGDRGHARPHRDQPRDRQRRRANAQFFGGGMKVAPRALPDDGRFNVQLFTGPRSQVFTLTQKIYRGEHLPNPQISEYQSPTVEVRPARHPCRSRRTASTSARRRRRSRCSRRRCG